MICKSPDAGGIYTFEKSTGGNDLGFIAFWFVLLTYLAVLWANVTSVPLFARFFLGNTFKFGFHYFIFGYDVWLGEVLLDNMPALSFYKDAETGAYMACNQAFAEYERNLSVAKQRATRDALTGVNNKYAYYDDEKLLNDRIENCERPR